MTSKMPLWSRARTVSQESEQGAVPSFERHYSRLTILERWRELAIRPSRLECREEDLDLYATELDDLEKLSERCLRVRNLMNSELPPHEIALDDAMTPMRSTIRGAGRGLFYCPTSQEKILAGETICYYCGHLHNFHSSLRLADKSYLMLVADDLFVDPGPLPNIKARFINDPINEALINCRFQPEPQAFRCAVAATRDIEPGEELFVSYGDMYWANQPTRGTVHHIK